MTRVHSPALPLLLVTLCLPACSASPPSPQPDPSPPARAELEPVGSRPLSEDPFAALGLTGANKPNGLAQRFRVDVPPETPSWVPRERAGLELTIAQRAADGWLAFYKGPLAADWRENAGYAAALYAPGGDERWALDLSTYLPAPRLLEIQDVRWGDGHLYFNVACLTYAREADGRCSWLYKVDPASGRVRWRTPPLTSNDIFLLHGPWVVAGYGFTAEPDSLYLVERESGAIVDRRGLDTAHSYMEVAGEDVVVVTRERVWRFRLPESAR